MEYVVRIQLSNKLSSRTILSMESIQLILVNVNLGLK